MARDLPRNVVQRGRSFYFRTRKGGPERYVRLPDASDPAFDSALARASRRASVSPVAARAVKDWTARANRYAPGEAIPSGLIIASREASKRARRRQVPFDLTPEQLMVLWHRSEGHCEVSGLPFNQEKSEFKWRPFAVSIDRVDCSGAYTFANVRLVCVCVNAALNQWGDEIFWRMIRSASERLWGKLPTFPQKQAKG